MGPGEFYTMFQLEGRDAAACYTMGQRESGIPAHWNLYIAVENADDAAVRAAALGGKVLAPPFDVFDAGRMAVIQDPAGAVFEAWQPIRSHGIGIANVPGAFCWADLNTPAVATASAFYSGLFGWKLERGQNDPSGYTHITNGERMIGGIPSASPGAPPSWLLYFQVDDCDASTAKATGMGAHAIMPPVTMENVGRLSVLGDPQGAVFALFTPFPRA
jgi:predicted enzyme related to lactoylglutathione lyase